MSGERVYVRKAGSKVRLANAHIEVDATIDGFGHVTTLTACGMRFQRLPHPQRLERFSSDSPPRSMCKRCLKAEASR